MPDARKTLPMLREEWSSCTRCELGQRRINIGGEFVFGEGERRSIMFIGEGPGREEEALGRPFIGPSGKLLRDILERFGLKEFYITNTVSCRSCSPRLDPAGQPMLRKDYKTGLQTILFNDEPPRPNQVEACRPRLEEEIYLVDPVLIVALGAPAAKTVLKRHIAITDPDVRGKPFHASIPGAGFHAARTEKKEAWLRKTKEGFSLPIEQSEVRYLCIPTLHPSYVLRKIADAGSNGPFRQFAGDIQKAIQVYERYMLEMYGTVPTGQADQSLDATLGDLEFSVGDE